MTRRVANGVWARVLPKVYRLVGAPSPTEQRSMAAALWAGDGAVVSHGAAGVIWGIDDVRGPKPELWVPVPRNPRTWDVVVHRGPRLDSVDCTTFGVMPITTPVRTLIDVAGRLEHDRLLAAMESVFRRKLGTAEQLAARLGALRDSGRPGVGRLSALFEERAGGRPLESVLEAKVWRLLCRTGLPLPERQRWVSLPGGRYRLDFAWPEHKVGLECDGWEHHGRRASFDADRARLAEFAAARWRILPVTWAICTREPERVERWLRDSLPVDFRWAKATGQ